MKFILGAQCIVCNSVSNRNICANCLSSLSYFPKNNFISKSQNNYFQDFYSVLNYNNTLKKIIHYYKFNNFRKLSLFFADLIVDRFGNDFFDKYDYIIPVPLHLKKYKKRGFNQSELIIRQFIEDSKIFLDIYRNKNTLQQSLILNQEERKENLQNSFCCSRDDIEDKSFMIFDDIFTTGATINAVAQLLYFINVKKIDAMTIAVT